jgi:hypothetical protein
MLRIPHCLDNRLTDGVKVVISIHPPHFIPQKHYFYVSGTHFCSRLSKPQGLVRPEGLGKFKKSPHRLSNPRPSGLWHSDLTTRAGSFIKKLFCTLPCFIVNIHHEQNSQPVFPLPGLNINLNYRVLHPVARNINYYYLQSNINVTDTQLISHYFPTTKHGI